jgi:hypothetical protein
MTKFTKKQTLRLENILYDLQRAYDYIQKSSGIAVEITEKQSNGSTYKINNPEYVDLCSPKTPKHICVVDKEIGSDIAGLGMALHQLKTLLEDK